MLVINDYTAGLAKKMLSFTLNVPKVNVIFTNKNLLQFILKSKELINDSGDWLWDDWDKK